MTICPPDGPGRGSWLDRVPGFRGCPPLLDDSKLLDLRAQLEEPDVQAFIAAFIDQWPVRAEHLRSALVIDDDEQAADAILSIQVASHMVGARRLEWVAGQLHTDLMLGRRRAVVRRLPALMRIGRSTARALGYRAGASR